MSYFLRNFDLFSESHVSTVASPTVSPRHLQKDNNLVHPRATSCQYAHLLKYCAKLPTRGHMLKFPTVRKRSVYASADFDAEAGLEGDHRRVVIVGDEKEGVDGTDHDFQAASLDLAACLQVLAAPSSFGVVAIARAIVLRYAPLLKVTLSSYIENKIDFQPVLEVEGKDGTTEKANIPGSGNEIVLMGLKCMFSVLHELNRRDSELCAEALTSLLHLIERVPTDALANETYASIQSMHNMLYQLRMEGSAEVSPKAASCMIAIAIAYGASEFLLSSAATLLCDKPNNLSANASLLVEVPENYHKLADLVRRVLLRNSNEPGCAGDWWSHCLTEHAILSSFDVRIPNDALPDTPDDRRLTGAIASDGEYVYALTCYGLFKYGTGLAETIEGKLYASNSNLKANKGSWLAVCSGALYLRRRQSSRMWVIDIDTLREIGEIILHTSATAGTILTDGTTFYQANMDEQWNFMITPLDDSFTPVHDLRQNQKFRLAELNYIAVGETFPIPHELPLTLPRSLQAQASDLQMGRDMALLLARNGKVYYAGDGTRMGLQDAGCTWMELVLPESVVSIAVGFDTETIVLRSGSGHLWIAGIGPETISQGSPAAGRFQKQEAGSAAVKLRKFQVLNRRRCVSVAVSSGCIAYVTDNGKAYVCGRHAMQCHPETGYIYGLENVHLASVALGKTHAVAITRHGHLYTWGLNNLNQCGRTESPSSRGHAETLGGEDDNALAKKLIAEEAEQSSYCLPNEHLWVKDFASICLKCGKCSARGNRCAPVRTGHDAQNRAKGTLCTCGEGETCCLRCGLCRACGESVGDVFDREMRGTPPRATLPPSRLVLQKNAPDIKVSSVCCGNYHTVVLAADRQVFTFGSNCHGQLGIGHIRKCVGPHKVELPGKVQVVQIAAGSNHTVLRTADGSVITFGAYRQGQLAREGNEKNWFAMPAFVPGYGRGSGTVATWIGASGDTTLIHSQTRIYSSDIILDCQIVADSEAIMIFPNQVGKDYMAIRRKCNTFYQYSLGAEGLYTNWCLESKYNLLWAFNAAEMRIKSISICIPRSSEKLETDNAVDENVERVVKEIAFLRAPEFIIPAASETSLPTKQIALNLLGTAYVATVLESRRPSEQKVDYLVAEPKPSNAQGAVSGRSFACGYQRINRFDGYGGGWGYSAHSVEAIQFRTSRDIRLFGVGLFGGRGEYIAKLKLYRLCPPEYDEQNFELLSESDEMLYECAAHEKAQLLFPRSVLIRSNLWHVICAQINGPSSDCGASGQSNIAGDDGVQFFFRNSRMSNNGTDINVGQIPEFLYISETSNGQSPNLDAKDRTAEDSYDFISCAISPQNLLTVSVTTIESLFRLLDWSIQKALVEDESFREDTAWLRERYMVVLILALRFLRFYICSLYLSTKRVGERADKKEPSSAVAEQMVQFASIISSIFEIANDQTPSDNSARSILLEEAVDCVVQCSHVLYPSSAIFLDRLAFLMSTPNRDWSLVALLSALSNQEYVLPILLGSEHNSTQFPILLGKMSEQFGKKVSANRQRLVSLQNVLRFLFEMAFASCQSAQNDSRIRLKNAAHLLITAIARELVTPKDAVGDGPPILQTPNRFRRTATHASWDVSSGAADAIALSVDITGITLHGVGVYCAHHDQDQNFVCEVLFNSGDAAREQWNVLEKVVGTLANKFEPCQREVAMLRLTKAIKLQPGCTYAVRLQINGGKTFCGEGGVGTVRLCNGSRMHFEPCSLSLNGTSLARGQIPFVLYSVQDDESGAVQQLADPEQLANWFVLLVRMLSSKISDLIAAGNLSTQERSLCSGIAGFIMVFLEANPQRALDIVATLDDLLPMVSSANGERLAEERERVLARSTHAHLRSVQTVVESAHPYPSCAVHSQVVDFGKGVEFMSVQFSEECCTGQADDILWVYAKVDAECYVPVGRYCGDRDWPDRMLLVPGNNLWFILESASYANEKPVDQIYGYRCTITGYLYSEKDCNIALEEELTWICASACRLLVQIPSDKTVVSAVTMIEDEINDIVHKHGALLRKGLNLSHVPTVNEVLKRSLPSPSPTSDLKFLKEFIAGSSSTVAGFLARWMMNEPVVDLHSSQLQMSDEETRLRIATQIKLIPRDQYGRLATCPNMKVEITVRCGMASEDSGSNLCAAANRNRPPATLPPPQTIKEPYRPIYVNKARYVSVTMMTAYQDYCFEELRLACYKDAMMKEQLNAVQQSDGSFVADWTPKHGGTYRIECRLDGFHLAQSYLIEVRDSNMLFGASAPKREDSQSHSNRRRVAHFSRTRFAVCDQRLMTRGVRIRASPALNSSQIGIIPRGATVSYIEEVENVDGVWLRLTDEACAMHCDTQLPTQAWCLQFSNHLGRSFLLLQSDSPEGPVLGHDLLTTTIQLPQNASTNEQYLEQSLQMDADETYTFCGMLPVPVYNYPSLDAVSADVISDTGTGEVKSSGWLHNKQGIWIRLFGLDQKYALVQDLSGNRYLQKTSTTTQRYANGNGGEGGSPVGQKPIAQIQPRSRNEQPVQALRPSLVDCCRTVFAAFLWHERLVKDAMVCSTYLKFHPELHSITQGQSRMELTMATPLHSLVSIWQEINTAVQASIEQHLVIPSPIATRQFNLKPISANLGAARQGPSSAQREDLCELCEECHVAPVTTHMRMAHPGCGKHSGGQGYNSSGKYTSGWSGNCGDGGRPSAVWYLMCAACRSKYLLQTPSGHQQERSRRWREFCASSAAAEMSPETIIKQNAMFLMELNACMEGDSKDTSTATSGWTINLFPQTCVTTPTMSSACAQAGDGVLSQPLSSNERENRWLLRTLSHASDPGPKQAATHLAVSNYNPLFSKRRLGSSPLTNAANNGELVNSIRRRMLEGYERRQSAEIVRSPSVALKSLLQNVEQNSASGSRSSSANLTASLRRPVLAFVTERHDLARIREAMATAVARATFFAHSFRVWNWLLKLVSAESSVADILWQYLTALNSYAPLCRWRKRNLRLATNLRLLPHPWRVCYLAGPIANKMVHQLHSFLHTVAVIVQSSGVDSNLRCLCFRVWTFQLTVHEQDLLSLICDVLASVGNVLADPSSDHSWNLDDSGRKTDHRSPREERGSLAGKLQADVKELEDITGLLLYEASSRQAMIGCLTDGSSETFWESGEEDKNRPRSVTVHCDIRGYVATLLTVYVDNIRDEGYRACSITVTISDSDGSRRIIHSECLDHQFIGWVKCCIAGLNCVQVVFRGSDPSVRIRQLHVFGISASTDIINTPQSMINRSPLKPSPSHQLLFSATQDDAFAVFQAIAAQAFSDEFSHEENGTLRQQVLDLLFSRVQLQPLQAFVCSHMISALEREVATLREKVKRNYSYACGLMVMLVKICGSRQGLEVFSVKNNVLITLSELLLFAPQVVQCQVLETIERLSKLFKPSAVDCSNFTQNLLAVIAKVITLQIRDKMTRSLTSASLATHGTDVPMYWRIDRPVSTDIGHLAKQLLKDLSEGLVNERWTVPVRTEIANEIMNLTSLNLSHSHSGSDHSGGSGGGGAVAAAAIAAPASTSSASESMNTSSNSWPAVLKNGKFWLAVAALSLLKDTQWLELSPLWQSLQDKKEGVTEVVCDNHDDGRTLATVYCEVCQCSLCRECFAVLHLNKRNRNHAVQYLGITNGCPQVEVHEGSTRLRLPHLLILFHPSTLNGMVEFSQSIVRENMPSTSHGQVSDAPVLTQRGIGRGCRFCTTPLRPDQMIDSLCSHEECHHLATFACQQQLPCGHICGGIRDEEVCLPCMHCRKPNVRQDADDLCVICFTDRLGGAPCIQLACEHIFHYRCVRTVLEKRWNGPRIVFRFMQCPLCKKQIDHPSMADLLMPLKGLYEEVVCKARLRLEYDGLLQCPAIISENSEYHNNPEEYAMERYMYVLCFKCGKAYFGGESRCQQELDNSQYNPEELICGGCSDVVGDQICGRHGVDFLEFKCRFCCSVAVYFCFGTTHFCAACHDDFQRLMCLPKQLLPKCPVGPKGIQLDGSECPLRVKHPPTGEEFPLGCGICRNINTF